MAESTRASATVIAFPRRDAGQDLADVVESMRCALEEQKQAVVAWRGAMGELRRSMQGLGAGVADCRSELLRLNARLRTLNQSSRRLQERAEQLGAGVTSA